MTTLIDNITAQQLIDIALKLLALVLLAPPFWKAVWRYVRALVFREIEAALDTNVAQTLVNSTDIEALKIALKALDRKMNAHARNGRHTIVASKA